MQEVLKQIIKKRYNVERFEFKEVSGLGNACVYVVKIVEDMIVVRIAKFSDSIRNNAYSLKKLGKYDFVPKLLCIGKIAGYNYSVEGFMQGKFRSRIEKELFPRLFDRIRIIHSVKSRKCGFVDNFVNNWTDFLREEIILSHVEKAQVNYRNIDIIVEFLLQNMPVDTGDYRLLHGDLNGKNILFTDNDCFIFDFEDSIYGDKEYDLGYMCYKLEFSDDELMEIISIMGYDLWKIFYYAVCVGIRKVALAPSEELQHMINKLEYYFNRLIGLEVKIKKSDGISI